MNVSPDAFAQAIRQRFTERNPGGETPSELDECIEDVLAASGTMTVDAILADTNRMIFAIQSQNGAMQPFAGRLDDSANDELQDICASNLIDIACLEAIREVLGTL